MLSALSEILQSVFGPFRLLSSHLFLIAAGLVAGFVLSVLLIPRFAALLPRDRGREYAHQAEEAQGKPTGTGVVFIAVFVVVSFLVVPFSIGYALVLACTALIMVVGFLDDRSAAPWGEYLKGAMDLAIALAASMVLLLTSDTTLWLPFSKVPVDISSPLFVAISTLVLWLSINATNCSDGVDGLSSTLVITALISLGAFLYFVVGHETIASYFLVPHYPESAGWAIMAFVLVGSLTGYLWHNAFPSAVLMGDAGSRALGLFMGIAVMRTGNPFFILIVSSVLLINGGTGLAKVALLRFFRIRVFRKVRFPLHDHFRQVRQWSNSQVLVRFTLVQLMVIIVLFGMLIKIR